MNKTGNMNFKIAKKGYDITEVEKYIVDLKNSTESSLNEQKNRIFELKDALLAAENTIKEYKDKSGMVSKAIINAVAKAEEIEKLSIIKYRQEIERLKAFHDKWISYYNKILRQYPLDEDLSAASKFNQQMKKILFGGDEQLQEKNLFTVSQNLEKTFDQENARLGIKNKGGKVVIKAAANAEIKEKIKQAPNTKKSENKISDAQKKILTDNGFDPIARISKYLQDAANVDIDSSENAAAVDEEIKSQEASAIDEKIQDDYSDRSALGFSFQEALNPKDDLEQIMKDLGLFSDE